MTDLRKAAETALEALYCLPWQASPIIAVAATKALRQALEESANSTTNFVEPKTPVHSEQKPVAWLQTIFGPGGHVYYRLVHDSEMKDTDKSNYMPLYASPPKHDWVGLTDGERFLNDCRSAEEIEYAKAIEAKLKEKNRRTVDNQDTKCKDHPDAPHGFNRNASLTEDRYVCDCEYWEPPVAAVNMSQERVDETAKCEHEPVAWLWKNIDGHQVLTDDPDYADGTWTPLYTAPPKREWVGLTEEEYEELLKDDWGGSLIRSVEAKLKEKNT